MLKYEITISLSLHEKKFNGKFIAQIKCQGDFLGTIKGNAIRVMDVCKRLVALEEIIISKDVTDNGRAMAELELAISSLSITE